MSKIIIICLIIIAYPILRLRYRKIFMDVKTRSSIFMFRFAGDFLKFAKTRLRIAPKKTNQTRIFIKTFNTLFHPSKGEFQDQALRAKVYKYLISSLKEGSNYRALYRRTSASLHPNAATNSRLSREELQQVYPIFEANFTHPDSL